MMCHRLDAQMNVKATFTSGLGSDSSDYWQKMLEYASKLDDPVVFDAQLKEMREANPVVTDYITKHDPVLWAASKMSVPSHGLNKSNACGMRHHCVLLCCLI